MLLIPSWCAFGLICSVIFRDRCAYISDHVTSSVAFPKTRRTTRMSIWPPAVIEAAVGGMDKTLERALRRMGHALVLEETFDVELGSFRGRMKRKTREKGTWVSTDPASFLRPETESGVHSWACVNHGEHIPGKSPFPLVILAALPSSF